MSRRIIDCGRMELRGAEIRFKQKGTLEAFDRNVADFERVFVRSTPSPEIRLFVDFVFPSDVFRVWQESTLVNYKEFLEKVEIAGLENFRALIRYTTRAGGADLIDPTSRAFAESKAPPERFANKDELADYDRALTRGDASAPGRAATRAAQNPGNTVERRAAVDQAWAELAPQLAEQEQADRASGSAVSLAGFMLVTVGLAIAVIVIRAFQNALRFQKDHPEAGRGTATPVFVVGGIVALFFLVMGGVYLLRASRTKKPNVS